MSAADDGPGRSAPPGPGQTLFAFVRHWSRRWHASEPGDAERRGRHVLVIDAVECVAEREAATINSVAREIGIDQSGASRLVTDALDAGYLSMRRSAVDGRRREVAVTDAGAALLLHAHRWQEAVFGQLTEDWTPEQRTGFHRAMLALMARSQELAR